jgi:hypothetical protein
MKRTSKPATKKPRQPHKFLLISEEMKQWSAMLQSELNSWPSIRSKSMFGFLFFYRGKTVFAGLPRTRGFDSPSRLIFKFYSMKPALRERGKADSRIYASRQTSSNGWFSFELNSQSDLRDALYWLGQAYESAERVRARSGPKRKAAPRRSAP